MAQRAQPAGKMGGGRYANLYGLGGSCLLEVGREWRLSWDSRQLKSVWLSPEGLESREDGWGKGSLTVCFIKLEKIWQENRGQEFLFIFFIILSYFGVGGYKIRRSM